MKKSTEELAAIIVKTVVENYLEQSGVYKELKGYDININITVSGEEKIIGEN